MLRTFSDTDTNHRKLDYTQSFRSLYFQTIEKFKDEPFITVFQSGQIIKKTFAEFDKDVKIKRAELRKDFKHKKVFVTQLGNSYELSLRIMAILNEGHVLFPLSPNLNETYVQNVLLTLKNSSPETDDFIYILTSGSTGEAKIVRQTEKAILANINSLILHHELATQSCIGTSMPLFHVNALEFSFLCSFFSGGKFVLFDSYDFKKTVNSIFSEKMTIYSTTPTVMNNIARYSDFADVSKFETLKYFVTAAAPLSKQTAEIILDKLGKQIIQGYGLSEAVNFSCVLPTDLSNEDYRAIMLQNEGPSIGSSIWGNSVNVLNPQDFILGEGEVGELAIQGFNVTKGYLGHPDFEIQNPNYLKTGDLGFFRIFKDKKYFFISGRKKDVAKRNGESVPLLDIDKIILPELKNSMDGFCVAFKNSPRDEEIGMVCRIDKSLKETEWQESLINAIEKVNWDWRPKVVLMTNASIRTESGKALRWMFGQHFTDFEESKFTKKIVFKFI